ncbi:unnamed protein product [Coffea canephora]|uniref:Uncharacterized protein n=1 Tax=Coffea canephora TaxID=49390 RepID=A0A068V4S9_COFCA|nr:unnamed protein product [Coffea canephora]
MAIMEAQTSPSPPFSTAGLGPCELSCSFSTYHLAYGARHRWVFWSTCGNDEGGCGKPHHLSATADGAVIKDHIKCFLPLVLDALPPGCLVQFWGLVKNEDKTYLTTCDQPFALCYYFGPHVKEICEYRKHCLEYLIPVDEDDDHEIGPPGRVFRSGLPEYARDVGDYTARAYPQRDYAVGRVEGYWALPIYHHPTRHLPIGVLEIVSSHVFPGIPRREVLDKLQVRLFSFFKLLNYFFPPVDVGIWGWCCLSFMSYIIISIIFINKLHNIYEMGADSLPYIYEKKEEFRGRIPGRK